MELQSLDRVDYESDEHKKIMNYFNEHILEFDPDDEAVDFIESSLKLNSKRKIKFGGFFYLILINMVLSLISSSFVLISGITVLNALGLILYSSVLIVQVFAVITLFKRRKIAKGLIITTYVMFTAITVLVATTFTPEIVGELIRNSVYILYMFLSKRVKYTFVE